MSIKLEACPDNFLKCLPKEQRNGLLTTAEANEKFEDRREGKLHGQITNLLRLREIRFVHAPFGRKVQGLPVGFPDWQLFIGRQVCFIECKMPDGRWSSEQREWLAFLTERDFKYAICMDLEQVRSAIGNWEKESTYGKQTE